ncbi:MAG TPA: hypothetical protein VF228_23465 [Iamia sp.]
MTTTTPGAYDTEYDTAHATAPRVRRFTETKAGAKTTEFMFMVLFIVGVLIATYIDDSDSLHAEDGWLYAAIAASAYFISSGLAKTGVREPFTDEGDTR